MSTLNNKFDPLSKCACRRHKNLFNVTAPRSQATPFPSPVGQAYSVYKLRIPFVQTKNNGFVFLILTHLKQNRRDPCRVVRFH